MKNRTLAYLGDRVLVHGVAYHKGPLAGLVTDVSDGFICIRVFHPTTPSLDDMVRLRQCLIGNATDLYWTFAGDY